MSEENLELVRRTMEEFNRGGPAAVFSRGFLSTEVVFDGTGAGIPGIGIFRGMDEVRRFFEEDWFGAFPFEEWEIQIVEPLVDHGDQVIFKSRQQGRGASSGAAAVLELGNVFTIRNGEIVRIETHARPEDAFEVAGLSESAMSGENGDNVRELVAAFNRGDADACAAVCLPDVEWEDAIFWTEGSRTFRGREGVREWVAQVREPWEDIQVAAGEIIEAGEDTLVVALRITGRGKGSGAETQLQVWQVMSFADGKTATRKVFRDRDEALDAAGLPG